MIIGRFNQILVRMRLKQKKIYSQHPKAN